MMPPQSLLNELFTDPHFTLQPSPRIGVISYPTGLLEERHFNKIKPLLDKFPEGVLAGQTEYKPFKTRFETLLDEHHYWFERFLPIHEDREFYLYCTHLVVLADERGYLPPEIYTNTNKPIKILYGRGVK